MKTILRPEVSIVYGLLQYLSTRLSVEDGRYFVVHLGLPESSLMTTIEVQECVPGEVEALRNTPRHSTVKIHRLEFGDRTANVEVTYTDGARTTERFFEYHPNQESDLSLGAAIASHILSNHTLSS